MENAGSTGTSSGVNGSSSSNTGNVLGLGKLRVLHEGKDPITGLAFRSSSPTNRNNLSNTSSSTLFILTTAHVLSYPITSTGNKVGSSSIKAAIIDELGAGVGCSTITETTKDGGSKLIVARDEAIYVYGEEGREGCYAYEGE